MKRRVIVAALICGVLGSSYAAGGSGYNGGRFQLDSSRQFDQLDQFRSDSGGYYQQDSQGNLGSSPRYRGSAGRFAQAPAQNNFYSSRNSPREVDAYQQYSFEEQPQVANPSPEDSYVINEQTGEKVYLGEVASQRNYGSSEIQNSYHAQGLEKRQTGYPSQGVPQRDVSSRRARRQPVEEQHYSRTGSTEYEQYEFQQDSTPWQSQYSNASTDSMSSRQYAQQNRNGYEQGSHSQGYVGRGRQEYRQPVVPSSPTAAGGDSERYQQAPPKQHYRPEPRQNIEKRSQNRKKGSRRFSIPNPFRGVTRTVKSWFSWVR